MPGQMLAAQGDVASPRERTTGIEPATSCLASRCSNLLSYVRMNCRAPTPDRTGDLLLTMESLCRLSYRGMSWGRRGRTTIAGAKARPIAII
jgi:hypothetical protein